MLTPQKVKPSSVLIPIDWAVKFDENLPKVLTPQASNNSDHIKSLDDGVVRLTLRSRRPDEDQGRMVYPLQSISMITRVQPVDDKKELQRKMPKIPEDLKRELDAEHYLYLNDPRRQRWLTDYTEEQRILIRWIEERKAGSKQLFLDYFYGKRISTIWKTMRKDSHEISSAFPPFEPIYYEGNKDTIAAPLMSTQADLRGQSNFYKQLNWTNIAKKAINHHIGATLNDDLRQDTETVHEELQRVKETIKEDLQQIKRVE